RRGGIDQPKPIRARIAANGCRGFWKLWRDAWKTSGHAGMADAPADPAYRDPWWPRVARHYGALRCRVWHAPAVEAFEDFARLDGRRLLLLDGSLAVAPLASSASADW